MTPLQLTISDLDWRLSNSQSPVRSVGLVRIEKGAHAGELAFLLELVDQDDDGIVMSAPREPWIRLAALIMGGLAVTYAELSESLETTYAELSESLAEPAARRSPP